MQTMQLPSRSGGGGGGGGDPWGTMGGGAQQPGFPAQGAMTMGAMRPTYGAVPQAVGFECLQCGKLYEQVTLKKKI